LITFADTRFSPDGKYILVVFQDVRLGAEGEPHMYYIPIDEIGTGATFKSIRLPPLFFPNPREEILSGLRPSMP
jgi:hypothetical protein